MSQFHVSEKKINVSIPSVRSDYTEKHLAMPTVVFFPPTSTSGIEDGKEMVSSMHEKLG